MPDLEQVQGKVVFTSDTKGVDEANSALGSFNDSLGNIITVAAGVALEQLTQKFVSLARDGIGYAIDYASKLEQTRISFDAFTGSVQKGGEAMQKVNDFAKQAPIIPLTDIDQAASQLLGFGFQLDDTTKKITTMAGTGTMVDAFGDTVKKVSKGNADALSNATMRLSEENEQLRILQEEHPKAGLATDKHNLAIQRLQDQITKTNQSIGEHTITLNKASGATQTITEHESGLTTLLKEVGELAVATQTPMSVAVDLFARAREGIFNLREYGQFGISADELRKFGAAIDDTDHVLDKSTLLPALEKITNSRFGDIFGKQKDTFAGAVQNIKDDFGRLAAAFVGVDAATGVASKGSIFSVLETSGKEFYTWIENHYTQLSAFGKSIGDNLGIAFQFVTTSIKEMMPFLTTVFNGLVALVNFTVTQFKPVFNDMNQIWKNHQQSLTVLAEIIGGVFFLSLELIIKTIALVIDWGLKWADAFISVSEIITVQAIQTGNAVISMINGIIDAINAFVKAAEGIINKVTGSKIDIGAIGHISPIAGGTSISGGTLQGLVAPFNSSNINITNNNHFNTPTEVDSFSNQLGLQVSLASG